MIQFSTMELLGALGAILVFQFTVIRMLGGHIVKEASNRLKAVERGLKKNSADLHEMHMALERKGIRVRTTRHEPEEDEGDEEHDA